MELIYRTKIHRPNKYERFHNEYYQKGDIVEKYTISSTRVQDVQKKMKPEEMIVNI